MKSYTLQTAAKVIAGPHTLEQLPQQLSLITGMKTVWLITQPSMKREGWMDRVINSLEAQGIRVVSTLAIQPEPTVENIEQVYDELKLEKADGVIGLGGGSVLDAAKLLAVRATSSLTIKEMIGVDRIDRAGLPTILIPTTSGTGSEVTPNAIVTLPEEQLKIGIVSRFLYAELVILDPVLTLSLPKPITAATGMDAFTHALESFISNKANRFSDMLALEAMRCFAGNMLSAYRNGDDLTARENMLVGSMYAGMALSSAGTAAVHALAYPIGGKFNVPHGVANSMLLPHVMEFNLDVIADRLAIVYKAMGGGESMSNSHQAEEVLRIIQGWTKELDIPQNLSAFGVRSQDVEELAVAASQVTRLMDNNPKSMTINEIATIYRKLLQ